MKLMILDGNSIVNRAFYGVRMLNAPDGTPTNGIFGFLSILQKLMADQEPDATCVAFDVHAPTFRHKQYADYKGKRKPMPEDLVAQMPLLKTVLQTMGITCYECAGWEADDILGTVGKKCEESNWDCLIVTGDKDSFQLITDTTHIFHVKSSKGQTVTTEYTPELFREEYGFDPIHIVDLKALMGDSSDNIPGVPGVGEKTASALIQQYNTIQEIYEKLDELDIRDSLRNKLLSGKESAEMSFDLATIRKDVPIDFAPEKNLWELTPSDELYDLFHRLGFQKFIDKWGLTPGESSVVNKKQEELPVTEVTEDAVNEIRDSLKGAEVVSVSASDDLDEVMVCDGKQIYHLQWAQCGESYNGFLSWLFSEEVPKIAHGLKELMRKLLDEKIDFGGFVFDTELAGYLLQATESEYTLERLTMRYCDNEMSGVQAMYMLYPVMDEMIRSQGMRKLMYDIELPLCLALAEMEKEGFLVDRKALYDYGEGLTASIDLLQQQIWSYAGHEFNINSPKQLGEVLFDELYLPQGKKTKTGWSTNAEVLEKLRSKHPIVQNVLDYRTLTKLKSTYADGLLKVIEDDGRIHTNFQMTVTATGRLSSTEPNLQNIPIRKELGSEIRKMFVAAPGNVLVDADYSQIELRLLAHISGDTAMRDAFLSGMDFHTVTAAQVFNTPVEEVTAQQRSSAKAVNFGIIYGMSAWSLAGDIGVSQAEAKDYMNAYYEKYPSVRQYMTDVVEKAKNDGYTSTLFSRRRYLPELKSSNFNTRSFGERVALNMPIQGTAADIIKLAMVNVDRRLKKENRKGKLILQVHDELIIECPEEEQEEIKKLLTEEMENVMHLSVPLVVETKSGHSWHEAH